MILGIFAFAAAAWFGWPYVSLAHSGAGYTAQQVCACLYVGERSAESCAREPEPPADRLAKWQAKDGRVTASLLGLGIASATSRFEPGYGCVLEN